MQKNVSFQMEDAVEIPNWSNSYPEHKFAVYKCCFLSTKPNSHEIPITEKLLREYAKTILGNFLVAKIEGFDCTTHKKDESIMGFFPIEQDIEFVEENGCIKAYAYAVVSKKYAEQFNGIFEFDNFRCSSVEMTVDFADETETEVVAFDIYSLCVLGKTVKGSCPDADIRMVRFSQEDACDYFSKKSNTVLNLQNFVEERKTLMEDNKYVNHPIDTTKKAIYEGEWDGDKVKQDLVKEKNYKTLAPKVCLKLEEGWQERQVTKLGYPVMGLFDGKWRYSSKAIASAQAYAEQHDEAEVLSKIKNIKKKLDLDNSDNRKEEENMENEENVSMAEVETEVETETVGQNFEENVEQNNEEQEVKMSEEEMLAKIEELQGCIEEKENIIMDKDEEIAKMNAELEELRNFKCGVEAKEKDMAVEKVLNEMTSFMDKEMIDSFREESKEIAFSELDAWSNKVKAMAFNKVANNKDNSGLFTFSAPVDNDKSTKSENVWDRLNKN